MRPCIVVHALLTQSTDSIPRGVWSDAWQPSFSIHLALPELASKPWITVDHLWLQYRWHMCLLLFIESGKLCRWKVCEHCHLQQECLEQSGVQSFLECPERAVCEVLSMGSLPQNIKYGYHLMHGRSGQEAGPLCPLSLMWPLRRCLWGLRFCLQDCRTKRSLSST